MSASAHPVKRQLTQKLSVQSVDPDPFTDIKEKKKRDYRSLLIKIKRS